jgi:cyclohexanecarboxylate-CoA ligase
MTSHPGVRPDSRLTPGMVEQYESTGAWRDRNLRETLTDAVRAHPDRVAVIAASIDPVVPARAVTYAGLDEAVNHVAGGLRRLGVGVGDSVVVMLPNRFEFATAIFAILQVGATYTGVPYAYGEREVASILRRCRPRVVIVSAEERGNGLATIRALRSSVPEIEVVVVVGACETVDGEVGWSECADADTDTVPGPAVDARRLAHIGFTSGTTGEPKGVMNSHQTLDAVLRGFIDHVGLKAFGQPVVNLVASPIGHHTGFLWGVLFTVHLAGTAVLLDRWHPERAADLIADYEVTTFFGAPTFLQDLLGLRDRHGALPSLRTAIVAGAPVPRSLVDEGREAFDTWVCPAWGMTELGIGISCRQDSDLRHRTTDGLPVASCQVRVVGPETPAAAGALQIRGPGLFLGYLERADAVAESFDDGWFDTGDLATVDPDGFITLAGRAKDIVIRGGENIPVTEVESLLFEHEDIVDAAVIGVPDPRLGERALAVIVADDARGMEISLDTVIEHLLDHGLSKHFLPEGVVVIDALPRTASGKVRKVELRNQHADHFTAR